MSVVPMRLSKGLFVVACCSNLFAGTNLRSLFTADASLSTNPPEAYTTWLSKSQEKYNHGTFLGLDDEVAFHWSIENESLRMAAAVEADGWLGIGVSDAGGMIGSDMVLFTSVDASLEDAFALNKGRPETDACQQDWTLEGHIVDAGFILFEASRALVTGDSQDHDILNDSHISTPPHRLIAAWGDSDEVSYHGNNSAKGAVRFFQDETTAAEMEEENAQAVSSILLGATNYTIPANDTTYEDFCYTMKDLEALGLPQNETVHMIAADFIIDETTRPYVHHVVVFGTEDDSGDCDFWFSSLYVWAPGAEPFYLPPNVGFALGEGGFKGLRVEIHYDNPSLLEGLVDNSVVRFNYTTELREHTAGVMTVGDPILYLEGKEIGQGLQQFDFLCPSSCTQTFFPQNVTVFHELLHMHETGTRMLHLHKRGGEVVHESSIDYYDFEQNGIYGNIQEPYQLQPGDEMHTSCYFKEDGLPRQFGPASRDEMCMTFIFYYPRAEGFYNFCGAGLGNVFQDPTCDGPFESRSLEEEGDLGRSFGVSMCEINEAENTIAGTSREASEADGRVVSWTLMTLGCMILFLSSMD